MAGFVYVASPYTSEIPELASLRMELARQATCRLISEGIFAFSPVVHGHFLEEYQGQPHGIWVEHGLAMLRKAQCIQVLTIPGWEISRGVKAEMDQAIHDSIPIHYLPFAKYCDLARIAAMWTTTESQLTDLLLSYGHVSNRP